MNTMWAQGDLVRVLLQTRLHEAAAAPRRRRQRVRRTRMVGSLRPAPAR